MSTTFGIILRDGKLLDLPQSEDLIISDDIEDGNIDIIEIAFRSSWGVMWKNSLAPFLHPDTKIYALDNSPQGIYTIGDIINKIN